MDIMDQIMSDAQMADREPRFHEVVKERQVIPQGDCNLHCVGSLDGRADLERRLRVAWPDVRLGKLGKVTDDPQIVAGHSVGSRHVIAYPDRGVVTIYAPGDGASPLVGPVIVATERFVLEHPEHAPHSIPAGTYQVIYQRDHAAEMARLAD